MNDVVTKKTRSTLSSQSCLLCYWQSWHKGLLLLSHQCCPLLVHTLVSGKVLCAAGSRRTMMASIRAATPWPV